MAEAVFFVSCVSRRLSQIDSIGGRIAAFRLDTATGVVEPIGGIDVVGRPMFLAIAPGGGSLATTSSVVGRHEGVVVEYAILDGGRLVEVCRQPSRGNSPCHLAYDRDARRLAVANYGMTSVEEMPDQSVAVFKRNESGVLDPAFTDARHAGRGANARRQERAHAHCVGWTPDGRFLVVADLGLDRLKIYGFGVSDGELELRGEVVFPPGAGPRHFVFHPHLPVVYAANELDSTVTTLAIDTHAGTLELLSIAPALNRTGFNESSAIKCSADGRFVYVSNRGHDSIGCLEVDSKSGIASLRATTPSGGRSPRDFSFDPSGSVIVVTNQQSDCLSMFRCDPVMGSLQPLGKPIPVENPMAVAFMPHLVG